MQEQNCLVPRPLFARDSAETKDGGYAQEYDRGAGDAYNAVAAWLDFERVLAEGMQQQERAAVLREVLAAVRGVLPYCAREKDR